MTVANTGAASRTTSRKLSSEPTRESNVERAFAALEAILAAGQPVTLDEATRRTALPKPTVYRLLIALAQLGLVERDPNSKRFGAGRRLLSMSLKTINTPWPSAERHRILSQLVERFGETCNYVVLDGDRVKWLDRVETSEPLRLHFESGIRVPLHCTASGKLFLSQLDPGEQLKLLGEAPYARHTPATLTTVTALRRELARIRKAGYSLDREEFLRGSSAIAVPVIDGRGAMVAALAMHGPAARLSLPRAIKILPELIRAARLLANASISVDTTNKRPRR